MLDFSWKVLAGKRLPQHEALSRADDESIDRWT